MNIMAMEILKIGLILTITLLASRLKFVKEIQSSKTSDSDSPINPEINLELEIRQITGLLTSGRTFMIYKGVRQAKNYLFNEQIVNLLAELLSTVNLAPEILGAFAEYEDSVMIWLSGGPTPPLNDLNQTDRENSGQNQDLFSTPASFKESSCLPAKQIEIFFNNYRNGLQEAAELDSPGSLKSILADPNEYLRANFILGLKTSPGLNQEKLSSIINNACQDTSKLVRTAAAHKMAELAAYRCCEFEQTEPEIINETARNNFQKQLRAQLPAKITTGQENYLPLNERLNQLKSTAKSANSRLHSSN